MVYQYGLSISLSAFVSTLISLSVSIAAFSLTIFTSHAFTQGILETILLIVVAHDAQCIHFTAYVVFIDAVQKIKGIVEITITYISTFS